jgi:hypothetical protein
MQTQEICVDGKPSKASLTAMGEMADTTPRPKGKVVASTTSDVLRAVSILHPAYSRLLRDTLTFSDGTGEL